MGTTSASSSGLPRDHKASLSRGVSYVGPRQPVCTVVALHFVACVAVHCLATAVSRWWRRLKADLVGDCKVPPDDMAKIVPIL